MSESAAAKKGLPKKIVLVIIISTALFFGIKKINHNITHETSENAQIETQIMPIIPRVSGYIKNLSVQDYDSVQANQLLAEIDDKDLQSQLIEALADSIQSMADLANSKATLKNAMISLDVYKGNIEISKVKLNQASAEFKRSKNLFADQAITSKQLEESDFSNQSAQKVYDNNLNELHTAESKIAILEAMVQKYLAQLNVKSAKINEIKLKLSYTKVYAPISGKIGKKNISVGQFVQAGTPLFSLVQDDIFWVTANFKENQIKHLYVGKEVELTIDAYPDEKIIGKISSISDATGARFALLPPDNSSGNFVKVAQRVPVKISIENQQQYKNILRAGLSVFVSTTTSK